MRWQELKTTGWTSAGTPIPTFEILPKDLEDEYWWRMKMYDENILTAELEELRKTKWTR